MIRTNLLKQADMCYRMKNCLKISNGALWNMLGSTMYGINSFVMLALVSRIGSVDEAGAFGIAFTTAQLLYIVGLFGVPHFQMTDYDEKYSFFTYVKACGISCFLMLLCGVGAVWAMGFTGAKRIYTLLLTVLMLLNVIGELYQSMFFQKNRLDLSGSALFFRTFWSLLLFSVVIFATKNILLAVAVQIVVNLAVTMYYALGIAPAFIAKPVRSDTSDMTRALIRECIPLAVSLFLLGIVVNMSKYGIEFMMDDTAQGY